MLKVCKFGGSSLSDEGEFAKVKKIIESDPSRKVVVVSALGKRNSLDNKITDLLYLTYQHLKYHVDWHADKEAAYEQEVLKKQAEASSQSK